LTFFIFYENEELIKSNSEKLQPLPLPSMPITFDMTTLRFTEVPLPPAGTKENPMLVDHTPDEMAALRKLAATDIVLSKTTKELNAFIKSNRELRNEKNSLEYQVRVQHDLIDRRDAQYAEMKLAFERLSFELDEVTTILESSQQRDVNRNTPKLFWSENSTFNFLFIT
jgi:uncharacterized coiled-coil protein SlyX